MAASPLQVQSLCKMAGGTKRARWPPRVTPAGRTRRMQAACGTAQAPREAAPPGGRAAMEAGDKVSRGRSPATRCVGEGEAQKVAVLVDKMNQICLVSYLRAT